MNTRFFDSRRNLAWLLVFLAPLFALTECAYSKDATGGDEIIAESALLRVVEQVSTPARAAGVLGAIHVKEGDIVAVGDLLAEVDSAEAKLRHHLTKIEYEVAMHQVDNLVAIHSAEKAIKFARQEYLRMKHAAETLPGSMSVSEVEESEFQVAQAELDLKQAKHELQSHILNKQLKEAEQQVALHKINLHKISAPIPGLIVEVLKQRGEWVEPGEDVLRIMRIDRLRAEGLVNLEDVASKLKDAQAEVVVKIAGGPEVRANGRVVFINPEVNPVNGRVRVRVEFDNRGARLLPGMRANLAIYPNRSANVKLPAETADSDGL